MARALLRRWGRLQPAQRRLLLETAFHLICARLILRIVPFRRLVWWLQRPARQPERQGAARQAACEEVCMAIHYTNLWLNLNAVCFPRTLAAQTMLRRRGVSTTLYYGATTQVDAGKLLTHVWLQDGERGIVAHENASQFQVLARYSPLPQAPMQQ